MYKVGDVVQLKSGGPAMTVTSVNDDGTFYCEWFPGVQSAPLAGSFPSDALLKR
jgi:uncharacterized protein YodC (DUF2158 family)